MASVWLCPAALSVCVLLLGPAPTGLLSLLALLLFAPPARLPCLLPLTLAPFLLGLPAQSVACLPRPL